MQAPTGSATNRRTRKRLATRQHISDTATRLFWEHGFDRVTVDEIATAADVGRMTVFNHFPRKEDMFFDREGELLDLAVAAVRNRGNGTTSLEAVRLLAHQLVEEGSRFLPLTTDTLRFADTALASETLKARARQMRDRITNALTAALAGSAGRATDDPDAHLAACLSVATWSVALAAGHRAFALNRDEAGARQAFLALIDQGMIGVAAALAGTPYGSAEQEPPQASRSVTR